MENQKNDVSVIPANFGIEEKKANELMGNLPQIKAERNELEKMYNDVLSMDIEDIKTSKIAKDLRLKIRDNRTKGIEVWHKTTKDFFLKGGQFVDAIKRKEIAVNERMEEALAEIEAKRREQLEHYSEFVTYGANIRIISDDDFCKLLNGAKLQHEAKIEAERLAEIQRQAEIERQRKIAENREILIPYSHWIENFNEVNFETANISEILELAKTKKLEYEKEQERVRIENEKLRKEAEAKEKALAIERAKREAELKSEREKAESERKALEEKVRLEAEKQAKLQAELEAKRQAELKAEREKQAELERQKAEAEKLAKAPIKKQMEIWIASFSLPGISIENEKINEIKAKFEAFKSWAINETSKL
jgi:colicin import membrane protein